MLIDGRARVVDALGSELRRYEALGVRICVRLLATLSLSALCRRCLLLLLTTTLGRRRIIVRTAGRLQAEVIGLSTLTLGELVARLQQPG